MLLNEALKATKPDQPMIGLYYYAREQALTIYVIELDEQGAPQIRYVKRKLFGELMDQGVADPARPGIGLVAAKFQPLREGIDFFTLPAEVVLYELFPDDLDPPLEITRPGQRGAFLAKVMMHLNKQ